MNNVIKCPHCKQIFFDNDNDKCPFCNQSLSTGLEPFYDLFGDNNPFNDIGRTSND